MSYFIVSKAIIFLFFVLPIFFRSKLGWEDEIKIKIKFIWTIFLLKLNRGNTIIWTIFEGNTISCFLRF